MLSANVRLTLMKYIVRRLLLYFLLLFKIPIRVSKQILERPHRWFFWDNEGEDGENTFS